MSQVEWEDSARDELADIWVQATLDERDRIEGVVLSAERDLKDDPLDVGESRTDRDRVLIRPPLTFWYLVGSEGLRVRIFRVIRPSRRS